MEKPAKLFDGIDTIIIRVTDLKKSVKWYKQNLGLEIIFEDTSLHLAVLDSGSEVSITLWETTEKIITNRNTATYPIFKSSNASRDYSILQMRKVKVDELHEAEGITFFNFYDPDGNILEACEIRE